MAARRRPEDQIQRAVAQHYRTRAASNVFMFAVPNGGYRRPVEAAIMRATGTVPGVPDLIWIKDGQVYGLELKSDDGRVTESQLATQAAMAAAGAFCFTAYGPGSRTGNSRIMGLAKGQRPMTRALPYTEQSLRRAISAARKEGLHVIGIRPDGTVIVADRTVDNSCDAQHQDIDASRDEAARWRDIQA
jgi:hypothetical protein